MGRGRTFQTNATELKVGAPIAELDTTITLNPGDGAKCPAVPFYLTINPFNANREYVHVKTRVDDVLSDLERDLDGDSNGVHTVGTEIGINDTAQTNDDVWDRIGWEANLWFPEDYGAVGDDVTDDTVALNVSAIQAETFGGAVMLTGTYYVTSMVTFFSDVRHGSGKVHIRTDQEITAVQLGRDNELMSKVSIDLPDIIQSTYYWSVTTGVATGGNDVGLRICPIQTGMISLRGVAQFTVGVYNNPIGQGTVHVQFFPGILSDNMENWVVEPGATGWFNSNNVFGGQFRHFSQSINPVVGTAHIVHRMDPSMASLPNSNYYFNSSVEGDVAEYQVVLGGIMNFCSARFETNLAVRIWFPNDGGGTPRGSIGNHVEINGMGLYQAKEDPASGRNRITTLNDHTELRTMAGDGVAWSNESSAENPVLRIYPAIPVTSDITDLDKWTWAWAALDLVGKSENDGPTVERVKIEPSNGNITTIGTIDHQGSLFGMFGATPVAQASHIADPTDLASTIQAVKDILVVLENLGPVASS